MSNGSAGRRRALAVSFIVLANVLGGVSYPAQKAALEGLPPATVTWLRNLVAVVALVACGLARRRRTAAMPWTRPERLRVLALGSVAFALPMWLGIVGVELASASNASILILLEPVTIVAIAWLVLGDLLAGEHFAGNALLALHGVLWGCYTPLAKPLSERHDPIDLCLRATLVSLPALLPLVLLEARHWRAGPELAPALAWTAALGLCVSFGGTVLWLTALRHIPATSVAGFVFLQPLTGVLVGVGWLDERLSAAALAGSALIVAGVGLDAVLTTRRGRAGA
jgi:drug/metabolite transporter (DMT)-like permease